MAERDEVDTSGGKGRGGRVEVVGEKRFKRKVWRLRSGKRSSVGLTRRSRKERRWTGGGGDVLKKKKVKRHQVEGVVDKGVESGGVGKGDTGAGGGVWGVSGRPHLLNIEEACRLQHSAQRLHQLGLVQRVHPLVDYLQQAVAGLLPQLLHRHVAEQ